MSYRRSEVFSSDPVSRKKVIAHEGAGRDGEWTFETKADVTAIIEANKAEYAATDEHARWGKPGEVWAKVASVHPVTWFRWIREGRFDPNDDASLMRWLSDRDNLSWRTRPGRLGDGS